MKQTRKPTQIPIIGTQIGHWEVIDATPFYAGTGRCIRCRCACGTEADVPIGNLVQGKSKGCQACAVARRRVNPIQRKYSGIMPEDRHRARWLRTYHNMCNRCYNTGDRNYKHYGLLGIVISNKWLNRATFLAWVRQQPTWQEATASIERKDVHGPYSADNCCLIPRCHQARNKSNTIWVEYANERLCASIFAARYVQGYSASRVIISTIL